MANEVGAKPGKWDIQDAFRKKRVCHWSEADCKSTKMSSKNWAFLLAKWRSSFGLDKSSYLAKV